MSTLEEVYNEWQNNPQFREQFQSNPTRALQAFHFTLSSVDLEKIIHQTEKMIRDNNELERRSSE